MKYLCRSFNSKPAGFVLLVLFLVCGFWLNASERGETFPGAVVSQQMRSVSGVVRDTDGNPLIGASIQIVGTTIGTITNAEGQYTIQVPDRNARLTFSYIGYKSVTLTVGERAVLMSPWKATYRVSTRW